MGGSRELEIDDLLVRKKRQVLEAVEAHKYKNKCRWCSTQGHFNKGCPVPYIRCMGICEVLQDHTYLFPKFCKLPNKKRGRRE